MVRIHIREQLCLLILITSLLALMVLAVSTWVQSHHYLQQAREQLLQVTANLKCDQVGQILSLSEESVQSFTNKAAVQSYVSQYDNGNTSQELRDALATSLQTVSDRDSPSNYKLTLTRTRLTTSSHQARRTLCICRLLSMLATMAAAAI